MVLQSFFQKVAENKNKEITIKKLLLSLTSGVEYFLGCTIFEFGFFLSSRITFLRFGENLHEQKMLILLVYLNTLDCKYGWYLLLLSIKTLVWHSLEIKNLTDYIYNLSILWMKIIQKWLGDLNRYTIAQCRIACSLWFGEKWRELENCDSICLFCF